MNKELLAVLDNWRSMNAALKTLTEKQLFDLLEYEREHELRWSVLERLHQRYTMVRASRERIEIMQEAKAI